jgi:hypothetical protein
MWSVAIAIVLAIVSIALATRIMWWATSRSAIWALAGGLLIGLVVLLFAVFAAWLMTNHYWGGLDQLHGR